MDQLMGSLSTLPTFVSSPTFWIVASILLVGAVLLIRTLRGRAPSESATSVQPEATDEGARIAAAIAASIVAMEDQALVAAITAAVRVYLETENGGKPLTSGFRVVSFRRRGSGHWNRSK